jgi:SAM-dependent methyltransferase
MHRSLADILVDPRTQAPLALSAHEGTGACVRVGMLSGSDQSAYPITNGIPRFILTTDRGQRQTESSFGFKWSRRRAYDSPAMQTATREWLVRRYGFKNAQEMREYFGSRRRVLDAGCGSGFSASCWMTSEWRNGGQAEWIGADISSAIDVAQERLGDMPGTHFVQADLLQLPFRGRTFDTVFSEGVLHHTPSTERALKSLADLLTPGGEILFYVYRKKGPVREFTDDCVRDAISCMSPEEAWEALRPLTRLGQALAELKAEVTVPEDIPYLEIKAGRYDVQRLVYWHFAKLFWRPECSFEENHHVNFDWYHPRYAHRHTREEILRWCGEAGLSTRHCDEQESGFTVRAVKD